MAWELIEQTPSGWKKYQTDQGNRYKRPNGKFASRYEWAGATASSEPESVEPEEPPEEPPEISIDDTPVIGGEIIDRDDLDNYRDAEDWVRDEYINIDDYRIPYDALVNQVDGNFDRYSYGVRYKLVKDKGKDKISYRHTTLLGGDEIFGLENAFEFHIDQLREIQGSYVKIVIFQTIVKKRTYQ